MMLPYPKLHHFLCLAMLGLLVAATLSSTTSEPFVRVVPCTTEGVGSMWTVVQQSLQPGTVVVHTANQLCLDCEDCTVNARLKLLPCVPAKLAQRWILKNSTAGPRYRCVRW